MNNTSRILKDHSDIITRGCYCGGGPRFSHLSKGYPDFANLSEWVVPRFHQIPDN